MSARDDEIDLLRNVALESERVLIAAMNEGPEGLAERWPYLEDRLRQWRAFHDRDDGWLS